MEKKRNYLLEFVIFIINYYMIPNYFTHYIRNLQKIKIRNKI